MRCSRSSPRDRLSLETTARYDRIVRCVERERHRRVPAILAIALVLPGCPHFQPELAFRPTPYDAASSFALAEPVTFRPELDDHRLEVSPLPDPSELAATPALVTACLSDALVRSGPYAIFPAGAAHPQAFELTLHLTLVTPGSTDLEGTTVSATAGARGSAGHITAAGSAPVVTAGSGSEGLAAAVLEIHAPDGTPVDHVRIFAQRFPRAGEPLDQRAAALCEILASETEHYLAWRIAGGG
jgi:hypothetical protein